LDEAAQWQALHAVLGLAAAERPQRRPEADEVAGDLHAEGLRRPHVPSLVQADRGQDAYSEDGDPDALHTPPPPLPAPIPPMLSRARPLAHDSAASTSSTVPGAAKSGASARTRSSVSTMPRKGRPPRVNPATHSSLAAL